jgi:hypothetical protein
MDPKVADCRHTHRQFIVNLLNLDATGTPVILIFANDFASVARDTALGSCGVCHQKRASKPHVRCTVARFPLHPVGCMYRRPMSFLALGGGAQSSGKTGGGSRARPVYCLAIWDLDK